MSQTPVITATMNDGEPGRGGGGTQERKDTYHLAASRLQPLPIVSPEETQDVKTQDTGPRQLSAYQKNAFSEPRLLHLPIHSKVAQRVKHLPAR